MFTNIRDLIANLINGINESVNKQSYRYARIWFRKNVLLSTVIVIVHSPEIVLQNQVILFIQKIFN